MEMNRPIHPNEARAALLLGIDGGGTKTQALLADESGHVLGIGFAGSANYHAVGAQAAQQAILDATALAFVHAGIVMKEPDAVCLGLAGVDRPADRERFGAWLATSWPHARKVLVNDAALVLAAGTPDGWGVGLICGTGSIAIGRNQNGRTARAGGWGYLLGDEGSGFDMGLLALRSIARAADGRGPQTTLTQSILNRLKLAQPTDLVAHIYQPSVPRPEIAELAALVETAAAEGDGVALGIVAHASNELVHAIAAVSNTLSLFDQTPCALAGGILTKGSILRQAVLSKASESGLQLQPVTLVDQPAHGAIKLLL